MRLFYQRVTTLLLVIFLAKLGCVCADCDFCESRNSVTCHSETVFSLCLDGHATRDYITCPPGYVCSAEDFVCYPKPKASPSCARPYIVPEGHVNRCGVCNDPHKVFSCINETTIAFCFGRDEPYFHESVTVCPESTVCNLDNEFEFCSDADKVAPSCIPEEAKTTSTEVLETTKSTSSSYEESPISVSTAKIPTAKITATTTILKKTTSSTKVSTKPTTQAASKTSKPSIVSTKTINITSQTTPATATTKISTESNRPPRTDLQLCKEMGEGFHRPDDDTTCTKFIYCYQDSKNNFVPQLDSCDNFFNATSQVCVTEKPAECA